MCFFPNSLVISFIIGTFLYFKIIKHIEDIKLYAQGILCVLLHEKLNWGSINYDRNIHTNSTNKGYNQFSEEFHQKPILKNKGCEENSESTRTGN